MLNSALSSINNFFNYKTFFDAQCTQNFWGFGLSVDLIMKVLVPLIFLFNLSSGFRTKEYQISNVSEFSIHATLNTLSDLQCSFYCFNDYACEGFEFNQTTCSILKDIVIDSEAEFQAWVNSVLSSKLNHRI